MTKLTTHHNELWSRRYFVKEFLKLYYQDIVQFSIFKKAWTWKRYIVVMINLLLLPSIFGIVCITILPSSMKQNIIESFDTIITIISIALGFISALLNITTSTTNLTETQENYIHKELWHLKPKLLVIEQKRRILYYTFASFTFVIIWTLLIIIAQWFSEYYTKIMAYILWIIWVIDSITIMYISISKALFFQEQLEFNAVKHWTKY